MFGFWDPTYWLFVAPALLLMLYAQWRVRSAYAKWSKVPNSQGYSGAQVAKYLLDNSARIGEGVGLFGVAVQPMPGQMTDNYDPRSKTLNLSQGSLQSDSVASMAVVAHEVGHAQQDAAGSPLMALRGALVPAVNIGSRFGPIVFIVGFLLSFTPLQWLGIALFASAVVFSLITLPVELDASRRALAMLTTSGLVVTNEEQRGARQVLSAAALTYVAALLMSVMQLLYYVFLSGRRRR